MSIGSITRREFGKAAAIVGLSTAVGVAPAQTKAPSERVRLGFIGVGNRGEAVLNGFLKHPDAEVVAICDLHQPYLDHAARKIGTNPAQFRDYRQLLDRQDVDAVVINTPDHWHALHFIHACQAGKDVYVEKPLSLSVAEGRAMVRAAHHYKRVSQVGLHRRSAPAVREMIDFIRGGGIGKVTTIRAFHIQNEWPHGIGRPKDAQPPQGLDWETWLGPAPARPYNVNRTLYRYRWFYDYSGGQMTNTGAHYLDLVQWALGQDAPRSVVAMGGKFADFDDREVPDTLEAMWTYDPGTLVTFSQYNASDADASAQPAEMEFRGTKGTVYFRANGYEVVPGNVAAREYPILSPLDRAGARGWRDGAPMIKPATGKSSGDPTVVHVRNFLDCIKSRATCNCDIETGHRSTSATLIANIALKSNALLEWDGEAERFTNNDAANQLLSYEYRKPYALPAIG